MKTKNLPLTALFASLTFVSSFMVIPVGPVPITLQTLFVILTGYFLQPTDALMAMVLHLLLKMMITGPQVFLMPSSGFLYGFILSAFLGSLYIQPIRRKGNPKKNQLILFLFLTASLPYLTGLPFMAYVLNVINGGQNTLFAILKIGLFPFIFGDLLKVFLAYTIIKRNPSFSKMD